MKRSFKSFVILSVLLALVVNMFSPYFTSYAIEERPEEIDICDPEALVYSKGIKLWNLDIRRTVDNFITSIVISLVSIVVGVSPNAMMACQHYVRTELNKALGVTGKLFPTEVGNFDLEDESICKIDGTNWDEDMCATLVNDLGNSQVKAAMTGHGSAMSVEASSIKGSMLGVSYMLEGYTRNEPLPVNLAFFWDQSISKVPVANKVLAAPNDSYKTLPILYSVYYIWQFSRDVSLGLMAIVLLYIGIMIIMRKKINPQVVVSVQYAIPKIIIGIALIIFSYPIGALIISLAWGLFRGAFPLLFNALLKTGTPLPSGIIFLAILLEMLAITAGNAFLIMLLWLAALVLVVLNILLYFKALLIYIKMVFSVITAPLEMVLGTVPGSESTIQNWFKRMAKYAISIVAMGIVVPITLLLAFAVIVAYTHGEIGAEVGGWGTVMAVLAPLIIVVLGFSIGLGIEKRIDSMFFGGKPKR